MFACQSIRAQQLQCLRHVAHYRPQGRLCRLVSTHEKLKPVETTHENPPIAKLETTKRPQSSTWLSRRAEKSPWTKAALLRLGSLLGSNSPKQVAQRSARLMYQQVKEVELRDSAFWHTRCSLPPTFQTWFTVTNLHIWLLTVRLRALPAPHGKNVIQGLIDHFFQDVEDRIRARLSKRISERIVSRELKTCRDQWQGLGMALDYGLISSDAEIASAVWRNFLGARGALGIEGRGQAINYAGLDKAKDMTSLNRDPEVDDKSGVKDFEGVERKKYVEYPELMWTLTSYIRREVARLESIPDQEIINHSHVGTFSTIFHEVDPIPHSTN